MPRRQHIEISVESTPKPRESKRLPFPAGWYQEYRKEALKLAPCKTTDDGGLQKDYSRLPSSAQMQRDFALFVERVGRDNLTDEAVHKHARRMYG